MQRPSVVLPEPDSPTSPTLSPSPTSIETPASASTSPLARDERLAQVGDVDECRARARDGLDVSALRGLQALDAASRRGSCRCAHRPSPGASASERSGVGPARHSSAVQLQRALNGQRPATSSGAGTAPSIECRCAQAAIPGRLGQEQPERVRVQRLFLDGGRGRDLEQRARVEHVDAVAHREGDAQVVRDHDQSHATRDLDGLEQREDLALRGHVERRRRLVGDQDLRIAGQGGGDADALAHAPRQLERIALGHAGIADADLGEAPHSLVAPRGPAEPVATLVAQLLVDVPAAAQDRVEHRERVLEYEPELGPAQLAQRALRQLEQIAALVLDVTFARRRRPAAARSAPWQSSTCRCRTRPRCRSSRRARARDRCRTRSCATCRRCESGS